MSDLKPCHWCGETDVHLELSAPRLSYAIVCPDCGARGPAVGFISNAEAAKESARVNWNDLPRLTDTDALREENARLRAALEDAANKLDACHEQEYSGSHPHDQKMLRLAKAENPARQALEDKGDE